MGPRSIIGITRRCGVMHAELPEPARRYAAVGGQGSAGADDQGAWGLENRTGTRERMVSRSVERAPVRGGVENEPGRVSEA